MKSTLPWRTLLPAPNERWLAMLVLAFFGMALASISVVNHLNFRTNTWDMGYFNQALYDYSHFKLNEMDWAMAEFKYSFGDHFEPMLVVIAPLQYIFGYYTLILVQIAGILFGGWGMYRWMETLRAGRWMPLLAMSHFLLIWGSYSAVSFDFHTGVVGAMFLPWIFLAFAHANMRMAALWWVMMLMCKEILAFWGVFIALAMAWKYRNERYRRTWALGLGAMSMVWFFICVKWIIPHFAQNELGFRHFGYHVFGDSWSEFAVGILTHPADAVRYLFVSHLPDQPQFDAHKIEMWKMLLLSGGFLAFRRVEFLLILAPVLAQKLYADKPGAWGINMHYSIELVPVIALAAGHFLAGIPRLRLRYGLAIFLVVMTGTATVVSFSTRHEPYVRAQVDPFFPKHWEPRADPVTVAKALALIPPDAEVSAVNNLFPHLSIRDRVYSFPYVPPTVEYCAILPKGYSYPFSGKRMMQFAQELLDSGEWDYLWHHDEIVILKRKSAPN